MTKLSHVKLPKLQYMPVDCRRSAPHKDTIVSLDLALMMLLLSVMIGARQPTYQRLARRYIIARGRDARIACSRLPASSRCVSRPIRPQLVNAGSYPCP
jgi:hypothetical protein